MIYKDKLEDLPLSIEAFEELERRFPDNSHRLDSYYQVYLMALRTGNTALASEYKTKMINAFPNEDYTIAISDPNYEYNIRRMDSVQDSIYEATYNSYLASDTVSVRRNFRDVSAKYPLATLMPKFMFLDALTYVQAGDAEGFKTALKALVEKYPTADVTELAGEMLKGILRGRTLMQGNVTGMTWNLRFGLGEDGSLSAADSARTFTAEPNTPYRMILMYPTGTVDKNQLLFAVAAYNFANFMVKEFDLAFEEAGPMSMLNISGFTGIEEILQYYKMIYGKDGYAQALDKNVAILPISEDNYETLMRGKTLEEYINFFAENFGEKAPELAARWKNRMQDETDTESPDEEPSEEAEKPESETPSKEIKSVRKKETPAEEKEKTVEQPAVKDTVIPETIVPDTVVSVPVPALEIPVDTVSVQPSVPDTTIISSSQDTVPAVQAPEERKELTLKEIEAIRKREAEEEEARKEEARKEFEAQQKAEKELQEQKEKERAELLKKQEEEEKALLKAKADREKQLEQDRKNKQKQAEADRKAKLKAREELRKQKERDYKDRLKQKEKERKLKEKAYKETLKAKEKARREAQKAKEAAARNRKK